MQDYGAESKSDDELFGHGGQEGSDVAYKHEREARRRAFVEARKVAAAQIEAARWTKISAIAVGASAIVAAAGVIVTAVGVWAEWVQ
jgi:hypothetical protein